MYDKLRRLAAFHLRRERRAHALDATDLVSETYLRLAGTHLDVADQAQFFMIASRNMRQVLVDQARKQLATKRGAGELAVEFDAAELRLARFGGHAHVREPMSDEARTAAEERADLAGVAPAREEANRHLEIADRRRAPAPSMASLHFENRNLIRHILSSQFAMRRQADWHLIARPSIDATLDVQGCLQP